MRCLLALLALVVLCSGACAVGPDGESLFYASFDGGLSPELSRGGGQIIVNGEVREVAGKVGQAAQFGRSGNLSLPATGNISGERGTIEFWLRPEWLGEGGRPPTFVNIATTTGGYLRVNVVGDNRLGAAIANRAAEPFVWRRVEHPVGHWKPGEWHHVAVTWQVRELRLYLDGTEAGSAVTDHAGLEGELETLTVGGPGCTLDVIHFSAVARPLEYLRQAFTNPPAPLPPGYLSQLRPVGVAGRWPEVGLDYQPGQDEARLPLVLAGREYQRGLGLTTGQTLTFELGGRYERLQGFAGVSALETGVTGVELAVVCDGKPLWQERGLQAGRAKPVKVDLRGVQELKLTTGGPPLRMVVWAQMALVSEGGPEFPATDREFTAARQALALLKRDAGRFSFIAPAGNRRFLLWPKHFEDPLDPAASPPEWSGERELRLAAAPGEYEPVGLVVAALEDLPEIALAVSDLRGPGGVIPASDVQLRLVARGPMRRAYRLKAEPESFEVVSRFAFPAHPFSLRAGSLREVLAEVHVPPGTAAGQYTGTLELKGLGTTVRLVCEVSAVKLLAGTRQYGMYTRMRELLDDPPRLQAELADMQRHRITTMWSGFGPGMKLVEGAPVFDYDILRQLLTACQAHGFHGVFLVNDNLLELARLMGKKVGANLPVDPTVESDEDYLAAAKRMLDGVGELQREFPGFELVLTHMDEVFGRDRLPLFLQFARIAKKLSPLRFYITLHTTPTSPWRENMAQVAPYVDIPSFNGHALDDYLRAGGSWEELGGLLKANEQEAWTYYNMRGSFFTPEWCRLVNGLYMWPSPLRVHIPWMYYSYGGDAFDDTDSERHDFAYAAPSREDPRVMVPTLHYLAMREGIEDMQYLETLEQLVVQQPGRAVEGQKTLDEVRARLPKLPGDLAKIEGESPVLIYLSERLSGADYRAMRARLTAAIMRLQP